MDIEKLKHDLKVLIIEECEKDEVEADDIKDDLELFSNEIGLELDSLDALQISMGLQKKYGIRLGDSKEFRRRVTTIQALAEFIIEENA
ncbi:MAG: phosphopantetheine-binding protein [Thiovulaceae bacterium]|nr:phosphopantetheine-binding protein [Sulfurimonadaceae bacterium]MCW9026334.1 phosphopantetheine-binding protein [Sulfurimonadaceae bacterium]